MKRFVCRAFLFCIVSVQAYHHMYFGPNEGLEQKLTTHLQKARTRIFVASYTVTGTTIARELIAAKNRGLDVQLVTDKTALNNVRSRTTITKIKRNKIPLFIFASKTGSDLMHHKYAVIDNTVWTGSMNWTKAGTTLNYENVLLTDTPEIVNAYAAHFETLKRRTARLSHTTPRTHGSVFFIPDHKKHLIRHLVTLLNGAQKSITIASFEFTSKPLGNALIAASKRGISVTIIIDSHTKKIPPQSILAKLIRMRAATIYRCNTTKPARLMHHKLAVIDDHLLTGSMNWTHHGLNKNQENVITLKNQELAAQCHTELKKLRDDCTCLVTQTSGLAHKKSTRKRLQIGNITRHHDSSAFQPRPSTQQSEQSDNA